LRREVFKKKTSFTAASSRDGRVRHVNNDLRPGYRLQPAPHLLLEFTGPLGATAATTLARDQASFYESFDPIIAADNNYDS